jgi:hypothetical protein
MAFLASLRVPILAVLACTAALSLNSEQASALKKSESICWKQYATRYLKDRGPKAMATTAGRSIPRDDTSCGFGVRSRSLAEAKATALKECNRWSKSQGHKEPCRIVRSSAK